MLVHGLGDSPFYFKELAKDLAKATGTTAPVISLQPSKLNFKYDLDLDDIDLDGDAAGKNAKADDADELVSEAEAGLKEGEEYDYDPGVDIVKHRHVSLFKIISNRYNVIRVNKRISRK